MRLSNKFVTVQIGKKGLTEEAMLEILKSLKTNTSVRVKLLKSFLESKDRKVVFREIMERLESLAPKNVVLEANHKGNILVVSRKKAPP